VHRHRKVGLAIVGIIVVMVGYPLYAFSTELHVSIKKSELLETSEEGSLYKMQVEFDNPSLLILTLGHTSYWVTNGDRALGGGLLDPFVIPPLGKTVVSGTFMLANNDLIGNYTPEPIVMNGITEYDLVFTTIKIPFTYYPSDEQTREFIQQL